MYSCKSWYNRCNKNLYKHHCIFHDIHERKRWHKCKNIHLGYNPLDYLPLLEQ